MGKGKRLEQRRFHVQRGSLVTTDADLSPSSNLAIVVSNDIQNESSSFILVVPLERRTSRLRAPFAVDLGRKEGFRELHTARCDWVTRIAHETIRSIERVQVSHALSEHLSQALSVALAIDIQQQQPC